MAAVASTHIQPAPLADESSNKKRAAESPTPSIDKVTAAKTLSSLKVPPKQKSQSQYVRFKSLMLKEAKSSGDKETSDNITKVAKAAFKKVEKLNPPPPIDPSTNTNDVSASASATLNLDADVQRYLGIKGRVIKDEQNDQQKFNTELQSYQSAFFPAATAHLQWQIIESTENNFAPLIEAIEMVVKIYEVSYGEYSKVDGRTLLLKTIKDAKDQVAHFKEGLSEQSLFNKLKNATDDELLKHVKEHRQMISQVAVLNKIKLKKQEEDKRKEEAEERELGNADMIKYEITSALMKQIKYDASTKHSSVKISYTKGGVSPKVFAKAFNVAVGSKKATIPGSEVGTKSLRYGAYLKSTDVSVKLIDNALVAQASYYMAK